MKNKLNLLHAAALFCCSVGTSNAVTNVGCITNPTTGAPEATSPWRNALGADRADGICRQAAPKNPAVAQPFIAQAPAQAPSQFTAKAPVGTQAPAQTTPPSSQNVQPNALQASSQPLPSTARPTQVPPGGSLVTTLYVSPEIKARLQAERPAGETQAESAKRYHALVAAEVAKKSFSILTTDTNFRTVLNRWSSQEGWSFRPEHWTINKDIPVSGSEVMAVDYKSAVRRLLNSTQMLDMPIKPCFYSNRVLRVVPETEACSRSQE